MKEKINALEINKTFAVVRKEIGWNIGGSKCIFNTKNHFEST